MHLCTATVVMIEHVFSWFCACLTGDMSQIEIKWYRNLKQANTQNSTKKQKPQWKIQEVTIPQKNQTVS